MKTSICLQCNITFNVKSGSSGKFCCKSCAATYNNKHRAPRSDESKLKLSQTLKRLISEGKFTPPKPGQRYKNVFHGPHTKIYGPYTCTNCSKIFWSLKNDRLCCSKECVAEKVSKNNTAIRRIPYFNIHTQTTEILQSGWEVKMAEWLDENKIVWYHPDKRLKWFDTTLNKKRTYLPDFYLPLHNQFLDIKNPYNHKLNMDKLTQLQQIIPLFVGDVPDTIKYVSGLYYP